VVGGHPMLPMHKLPSVIFVALKAVLLESRSAHLIRKFTVENHNRNGISVGLPPRGMESGQGHLHPQTRKKDLRPSKVLPGHLAPQLPR
jgi:hypothetical protein